MTHLVGFGAAASGGPIAIVDDGDAAPSSGTGTSAHTYNSLSSSGPVSVALVTWADGGTLSLSSATWGGSACTVLVHESSESGTRVGAGIVLIDGAQSGDLVLNWSGNCSDSHVTVVGLENVISTTPVDTDQEFSETASVNLDSLIEPGDGGIQLACFASTASSTAVSWNNVIAELSDLDAGAFRHSAAYGDNQNTSNIFPDNGGASVSRVVVGVSLR